MNEQATHRWYQLKLWHLLLLVLVVSCLTTSRPWEMIPAALGMRHDRWDEYIIYYHDVWIETPLFSGSFDGPFEIPPPMQLLGIAWFAAAAAVLVTTGAMLRQPRPTLRRSIWLALCLAACIAVYLPYAALYAPLDDL